MGNAVTIIPLGGMPRVQPGDDLPALIADALERAGLAVRAQDIVVVTQKIVSKAEGRYLDLDSLEPSPRALELAAVTGKDAHLVEAVLSQSVEVLRARRNVLITETRTGLVVANAGVDQSNVEPGPGRRVLLLPEDPDGSAQAIKERLEARFDTELGVIISDSCGRAWRLGVVGLAIGAAGVPSLLDRRGEPDLRGRPLEVTEVAFADAVAAGAVLAMGEAAEATPAALVRGFSWSAPARPAAALRRPKELDLFR